MSVKKLKVGFVEQSVRRFFHVELARYLVENFAVEPHIYSHSQNSLDYYRKVASDVFAGFHLIGDGVSECDDLSLTERARYYEGRYGVPMGWFKVTDRVTGLGYSPGGFYHPRSKNSDRLTDEQVLASYIRQFDYWESVFQRGEVQLLLNGFYFEYFPAQANGVAMRTALPSRNQNYYFWSHNCFGEIHRLETTFEATENGELEKLEMDTPILNSRQLEVMKKRSGTAVMLKRMAKLIYSWSYRQYKRDGNKQYKLFWELMFVYREWKILRYLYSAGLPMASELRNTKYVLYALQVEPEINFQGYSPEYFCQLSAIISLSRDLPAGVRLVVKEHIPAVSRRPDRFYDQIRLLKNVIFVDPRNNGLELVRYASAVATINGTVGQEAAVLGKPVISFGRRNLYNFLDHVRVVEREEDLHSILRWALSDEFNSDKAARDGQRYLKALQCRSFSMADFGYHNPEGFTDSVIAEASNALMDSVSDV